MYRFNWGNDVANREGCRSAVLAKAAPDSAESEEHEQREQYQDQGTEGALRRPQWEDTGGV